MLAPWKENYTNQHIKKQRYYLANKDPSSQRYGFSSSHIWMWELDHKESWVPKNWCFWTVCWRRLLRVPWTERRSNQSILNFFGRNDAEAETVSTNLKLEYLVTWCKEMTHWKRSYCWKRLKAGDEGDIRGWDDWMASPTQCTCLWASSRGWWERGSLTCCSSWGCKELDTTEWLNWTED